MLLLLLLLRRKTVNDNYGRTIMNIRKKFLDYEYEEVLDGRVRELIRVGCAIAVGCPT